jgi:hypothetical protein
METESADDAFAEGNEAKQWKKKAWQKKEIDIHLWF